MNTVTVNTKTYFLNGRRDNPQHRKYTRIIVTGHFFRTISSKQDGGTIIFEVRQTSQICGTLWTARNKLENRLICKCKEKKPSSKKPVELLTTINATANRHKSSIVLAQGGKVFAPL
jgi:hypothetical protein